MLRVLKTHILNKIIYCCLVCNKKFSFSQSLSRHKRIHINTTDKNITISIGSSESNCKIFDIYTFIELYPIVYSEQKIPKRIIQTSVNNSCKNIYNYNAFMTFIELNPEYEYYFFDNNDVKKFIRDNFDEEVLEAYDTLVPGSYKADLFRACVLYIRHPLVKELVL
jgi:mannosyltransferase OCH1-like enzyme